MLGVSRQLSLSQLTSYKYLIVQLYRKCLQAKASLKDPGDGVASSTVDVTILFPRAFSLFAFAK